MREVMGKRGKKFECGVLGWARISENVKVHMRLQNITVLLAIAEASKTKR